MAARLAERHGDRVVVDFAMRYGNPSTPSVIARLRAAGLRAHRSSSRSTRSTPRTTTATANDEAFRALMTLRWQPAIRTVPAYYDHPLYIEALARSVEAAYAGLDAAAGRAGHQLPRHAGALPAPRATPTTATASKTTRLLRDRLGFGRRTRWSSPSSRASAARSG